MLISEKLIKRNEGIFSIYSRFVTIQDILVYPGKNIMLFLGEVNFNHSDKHHKSRVERIADYIEVILEIAAKSHLEQHFETDAQKMKAGHENCLTRVLLYEYSLATASSPISYEEFHELLTKFEALAQKNPENLIILISSLLVTDSNNQIYNYVVNLQCGPTPKINVLAKLMSSEFEKFYPNTKNALFTEENNYTQHFGQSDKVPPSGLLGNISLDNTNINYETTFLSETAGGTKFLTNIEICWTHAANIGKKQAERFVENSLSNQPDKIMPLYGSNVVTSNSIEANLKNSFTMQIAQADPRNHYSLTEQSNNFSEEFIEPLREKYPDIGLSCEETGTIQIDNPTFGEKIQITSYRPYTLNAIVGKNGQKIFDHNCALMGLQITQDSDYIATIREKHPSSYDIIQKVFVDSTACIENISLIPNKNTLEKLLLLDCYLAAACYSSQPEKKPSKLPAILTMNIADRTYEIKNLATFMEKIQAYFGFSFPKYSEAKMKNVDKQILYYPPNIYFSQKPSAPKSNPSGFFTPSSHTVNYQPLVNKIFSICAESLIVDAHVAAAMNKFSQYYKSLTQNLSNDTACYDLFYKCILKKIEINPLLISVFNREDIILLEPEDNSESVMKNIKFLGEKIDELDYVLNQRSISFS